MSLKKVSRLFSSFSHAALVAGTIFANNPDNVQIAEDDDFFQNMVDMDIEPDDRRYLTFLSVDTPIVPAIEAYKLGYAEFCNEMPQECEQSSGSIRPVVFEDVQELLKETNDLVNLMIAYKSDIEKYGVEEKWALPDNEGDCEDYALDKRRILSEHIPVNAMMIGFGYVGGDPEQGHAVLIVRTTEGDKVLDNRTSEILNVDETDVTFLSVTNPQIKAAWLTAELLPDPGDLIPALPAEEDMAVSSGAVKSPPIPTPRPRNYPL